MAGCPPNPKCRDCGLWETAKNVCIPGHGPEDAKIVVIGEAPGHEEDRRGLPFQGRSGQLLRSELKAAKLGEPFITNVVRCRPPDNRKPTAKEIKACRKYLEYELETIKPEYVITLGAVPSKEVLKKSKITQDRGRVVPVPKYPDIQGMPTFHPAYALRDPSKQVFITRDLQRLKRHIRGETVEGGEDIEWKLVTEKNEEEFLSQFIASEEFAFDIETNQLFPFDDKGLVTCLNIALSECSWVIPVHNVDPIEGATPNPKRWRWFQRLLKKLVRWQQRKEIRAIGQNAKFDNNWLRAKTGEAFRLSFDTMLAHYILDENQPHDLKYLARFYLDVEDYDLTQKEKQGFVNPGKLYKYNGQDGAYTLQIARILRKELRKDLSLRKLYYNLTMPSSRALEAIEARGIPLDLKIYGEIEKELREQHRAAKKDLDAEVWKVRKAKKGKPVKNVNWNSPQQVAAFLFGDLGLESTVKTGSGADSTGEEALANIAGSHPALDKLIRFRELEKFLGTYLDGWKPSIVNGRLFLGYKISGTVTGRFSSRLHQIPRDGRVRNIATGYTDSKGRRWVFGQGDLSQAELRIAGHISGDAEIVTAFRRGIDLHWKTLLEMIGRGYSDEYIKPAIETANELILGTKDEKRTLAEAIEILRDYGHEAAISVNKIWKEARKKAKAVNFGFIYGMYEKKFMQTAKLNYGWDCDFDTAHGVRESYFGLYRGLEPWHDKYKKLVRIDGYVTSMTGRRRRLPGAQSADKGLRMEAERQAINSPVQGAIGDWKAMAMIEIEETIDHDKCVIIGEHHDALLFLFREDCVAEIGPKIKAIMKAPKLLETFHIKLDVPMESDLDIGNWGRGLELYKYLKEHV